jgi:hypothetical protein
VTAPRYRYRIISFDNERMRIEKFEDSSVRDRRAAALAAEGKAVLVCEVLDVIGGGDEGAPGPLPGPLPRRQIRHRR